MGNNQSKPFIKDKTDVININYEAIPTPFHIQIRKYYWWGNIYNTIEMDKFIENEASIVPSNVASTEDKMLIFLSQEFQFPYLLITPDLT